MSYIEVSKIPTMKFVWQLCFFTGIYFVGYSQSAKKNSDPGFQLLALVSRNLLNLKRVGYIQKRELNYSSENYLNKSSWQVYCDFESSDTTLGFRFQAYDNKFLSVFNGVEKFDLDKTAKTIQIDPQPGLAAFSSASFFYNSLITLRQILPMLLADNRTGCIFADTILNNKPFQLLKLYLQKRRIMNLGNGFDQLTTASNLIYTLVIDNTSLLPVTVIQSNDQNTDFIRTDFVEVNPEIQAPAELSWYYSTYSPEYKTLEKRELPILVAAGTKAPDFLLPAYRDLAKISLGNFAGKIVLLDFWIKNCGPCIRSIPFLNALQEKYRSGNFEIVGINSYDSDADIAWYCNKFRPAYRILIKGKSVAEKYGVDGFPTYVLLGRDGKVIYSGNQINELGLEKMVQSALNQDQ